MDVIAAVDRREVVLDALSEAVRLGTVCAAQEELLVAIVSGLREQFATEDARNLPCLHLPMLIGQSLGGPMDVVSEVAAACVALYGAARLLDDVMDGHPPSYFRTVPSVELVLGGATMLCALGYHALTSVGLPAPARVALTRELASGAIRMSAGQQLELNRTSVITTAEEVLAVARGKSGAMVAAFASCGAIAAGASGRDITVCVRLGGLIGVTRQLAADLNELMAGDPRHDLSNGIATLPIAIHTEALAGDEQGAFANRCRAAARSEDAHRRLIDELTASGALARTVLHIELLTAEAAASVSAITSDPTMQAELCSIVEFGSILTTEREPA